MKTRIFYWHCLVLLLACGATAFASAGKISGIAAGRINGAAALASAARANGTAAPEDRMSGRPLSAQQTITGKVLSAQDNMPMPGVTVTVKGSDAGTATGDDGSYSIQAENNDTLVFSFLGYETLEVAPNGKTVLDVVLQQDLASLDEVVVVGYGTQRKTSLTASVSTIQGEEIKSAPVANVTNSLGGRVPGLIVRQNSGEPGYDGSSVFVRGVGTTGSRNGALFVVDGVVRNFAQLDPNQIESVTVLKDAAAVAPYGLAGANGVILVTTKKGKTGKPSLTYNGYAGFQQPTRLPEFVNSYEYATLKNAASANVGAPPVYTEEELQKFRDGSDPDAYPNFDVLDEIISDRSLMTGHNLEISGGTEEFKYYSSLGYLGQDGMWPTVNYRRYNLAVNLDAKVTNTTNVSLQLNGRVEDRNFPITSTRNILYQAFRTPPVAPLRFSNGLYGGWVARSVLGQIYGSGYTRDDNHVFFGQLSIEQKLPIEGLSVKGVVAFDRGFRLYKRWATPIVFYELDKSTSPYSYIESFDGPAKPSLSQDYVDNKMLNYQAFLTYKRTFGKHDIGGLLVLESRIIDTANFGASRINYNLPIDELDMGSSSTSDFDTQGSSSKGTQTGLVYRVNYAFDGKYLLEASGRYDGHYYFAPGKRYAYFPAFSAGWRISEEPFFKDRFPWIDNLKIRGSWGKSGNLAGAAFQYLSAYDVIGNAYIWGGNSSQGVTESAEPNPGITWEVANKTNIGLEAELWKGRIVTEVDYFYEKRSNMLVDPQTEVPIEYGIGLSDVNGGIMSNKGVDFSIQNNNTIGENLLLNLGFNFTYARNKLIQIFEDESTRSNPNRSRTGKPLDTQFGYRAIGYFQSEEEIADAPTQFGEVKPGDIRYEDVNQDGQISSLDEVVIGKSSLPEIIYGFTLGLQYKGFDLNLLFQGAGNCNYYVAGESVWPFNNNASALKDNLDYWTPENRDAKNPRITPVPTSNNTQRSSFWIENSAYLRLKTANLGYTLPSPLLSKLKLTSVRFFLSGQNLLTFTKLRYYDPEISSGNAFYYFQQRVVSLGMNINF